jgi:hypothetical protein
MNFAFDIEPVVERLRAQLTGRWIVDTSAALDAAMAGANGVTPAVYVVPVAERSAPHAGGAGRLVQSTDVFFACVICVRNYRAANLGGDAIDDLVPARRAIADALVNWMPPGCELVVDHDSGRLEKYTAGNVWWQEVFRTRMRLEKNS